ncbi:c-type cytochrome [Caenimonas terrae]|uniref:C-type cytochrome n=1 Tax=Caenimonas terrae TaxID=696074 RepID=A0ABW0N7D6_9BURK
MSDDKQLLILLLACAGLATPAWAQDGSIEQGRQLAAQGAGAAVAACAGCHGARGEGGAAFPRLAGTGQAYLQAQLEAFASGARKNPLMQPIAQGLTPAQRKSVTLYYSQLPPPLQAVDAARPTPADAGAWLATRGRWADQVPACAQCHGPGGNGVGAHFPPLAGLPAAYIAAQLQAWKDGTRPPGPLGLMQAVASKLGPADVGAVSSYYAGLGAAAAGTAPPGEKGKATP